MPESWPSQASSLHLVIPIEGEVDLICLVVARDGPQRVFQSPIHDFGLCPSSSSHFDLAHGRHRTGPCGSELASRVLFLGFFGMRLRLLAHPMHRE